MLSIDIKSTSVLNIYGVDYLCIILGIHKNETTNFLRNADLSEKLDYYEI